MSQITNIHGHEVLYDGLTNTVKIRYMNPKNVLRGNRNLVELFLINGWVKITPLNKIFSLDEINKMLALDFCSVR